MDPLTDAPPDADARQQVTALFEAHALGLVKLAKVMLEGASEQLLDLYNLQRRTVAIEFVQEQSIANKKRLEASDPEVRKRNLDELRQTAADRERARAFLLRTAMIASQRRAAALAPEI